jgi:uncharacterized protein (DUF305 family)
MSDFRNRWLSAALALPLAACSGAASAGPGPVAGPTPSAAEMEAIYRARMDSARTRFTPADVRFMTNMIHHHAQALHMAQWVPARSTTPSIEVLAGRITNAQRDEIAIMQRWLRDRGQPVPELHVSDAGVMVHGHEGHEMEMPGMIPAAELRALEAARGAAFDRMFLELMIRHHAGAVTMVHELFATDGAANDEEVFKFASDVQVDQTTEVARMRLMLAGMPDGRRP